MFGFLVVVIVVIVVVVVVVVVVVIVVVNKNKQGSISASFDKAEECCKKGNAYFQNKDYDQAIEEFTRALQLCPAGIIYIDAYWLRSIAYEKKGDWNQAIKDLDVLIEQKQSERNKASYYTQRGDLFVKKRNYASAVQDYLAALELDPDNSGVQNKLEESRKKQDKERNLIESNVTLDNGSIKVCKGIGVDVVSFNNHISMINNYWDLDDEEKRIFKSKINEIRILKAGSGISHQGNVLFIGCDSTDDDISWYLMSKESEDLLDG